MIAFDLKCSNGHIFEGWFNNLQSFEEQSVKGLISCPYCNDTQTRKVLSPVSVKTSSPSKERKVEEYIDYERLAREIVNYIDKNFEDVGSDFTKEALKMHYGVSEKRNIKGAATTEEENLLRDEGIKYFKVPVPKVDDDKKN